jgi:hypothetical protein
MTANKPTTGSIYGYIIVLYFRVVKFQIVIASTGNAVYIRSYAGNPQTWNTWRTL